MALEWDDIVDAAIEGVVGTGAGMAFQMIVKSEPNLSDVIIDILDQVREIVKQEIRRNEIERVKGEAQTAIDLYRAYVNAPSGIDRLHAATHKFAAVGRQLERFGISGLDSYLLNQSMYLHALADRRRLYGDAEVENIRTTLRQSLEHNQHVIGVLYRRSVPYLNSGQLRYKEFIAHPDKPHMYDNWEAYSAAQFAIMEQIEAPVPGQPRLPTKPGVSKHYRILKVRHPGSKKFKFYNKKKYREEGEVIRYFYRAIREYHLNETRPHHLAKPNKIYRKWDEALKALS